MRDGGWEELIIGMLGRLGRYGRVRISTWHGLYLQVIHHRINFESGTLFNISMALHSITFKKFFFMGSSQFGIDASNVNKDCTHKTCTV